LALSARKILTGTSTAAGRRADRAQRPSPLGQNVVMRFDLGDFELDLAGRRIGGPGGDVHVEPQVFDVLTLLVQNRDRAVPKTEILDTIWGDQFVSESALTSRIRAARAAIGDDGRTQGKIRTVHRFGYQFVGDVVEHADPAAESGEPAADAHLDVRRSVGVALPHFSNPLRGRSAECAELGAMIAENSLVTVVGPGGIGKTRMAVEVAGEAGCAPTGPRNAGDLIAVFVDLAAVRNAADVAQFTADAVGIRAGERGDVVTALGEFLDAVPHLLLLDNCEHVLEVAAEIADRITRSSPESRVLATSREPLGASAERVYRLGTLPVPSDADVLTPDRVELNPAAALFVDRARQADHTFRLTTREARQIGELSRALDGLPLALELAAGRVAALGLDDLVARLDQRLDVLRDRGTTRESRHRTLRATVEWSYNMLDDDHQRLLRTLSVLPSGATLDTIEWLADELGCEELGADIAADLVDASFLVRVDAPSGSRYTQLETLRTFGLDRLGHENETTDARDLTARWLCRLLDGLQQNLRSPEEPVWVDRVRREFANIREIRAHLVADERWEEALDIAVGLNSWSRMRDATEVWSWADELAEAFADGPDHMRGRSLVLLSQAEWRRGNIVGTAEAATAAIEASDDEWTAGRAQAELGVAKLFSGDFAGAEQCWITSARLIGDGVSSCTAAIAAAYAGDTASAARHLDEGDRISQRAGNPSSLAWSAYARAEVRIPLGATSADDPAALPSDERVQLLEGAISLAETVEATFIVGVAKVTLAGALAARGDVESAATTYRGLIEHWLRTGSWTQLWTTLRHIAELVADCAPETALLVLRAAADDADSPSALAPEAAAIYAQLERELLEQHPDADLSLAGDRVRVSEAARTALEECFG
jgi:predicted ATPase/DNA-binding winged helix-turn-helix (wHTH) protein